MHTKTISNWGSLSFFFSLDNGLASIYSEVIVCTVVYLTRAAQGNQSAYLELLLSGVASLVHIHLWPHIKYQPSTEAIPKQSWPAFIRLSESLAQLFSTTPHTQPMFTHKPATWLQTQGTQPFMQTSHNTCTPCVMLVPPPCHAHTPSCNICIFGVDA